MASFGGGGGARGNNDQQAPSQAPSGSRLAQYLNGRPLSSNHQGFSSAHLLSPNGYSEDAYAMGYAGNYDTYSPQDAKTNEEILSISQNIPPPLVDLQLANPDTLKQRWAMSANATYFVDADLRARLLQRQLAQQCFPMPNSADLPEVVEHFRSLQPIGHNPVRRFGANIEHTYKAISSIDGVTYAIHRVTYSRPLNTYATTQVENWRRVAHSNVVRLHAALPTSSFKDSSHLFVYDFHGLAEPLAKHFFHNNGAMKQKFLCSAGGLNEQLVWNVIIQISGAIRQIHASSMAVRSIDLNRVLVNSSGRFLISGVAIADFFADTMPNLLALQIEDLRMFGAVLVSLVSGSLQASNPENITHAVQQINTNYSSDLRNVVKVLCHAYASTSGRPPTTINEIMPMIGARFYSQVEAQQIRMDMLENDLCKELQNGRLFRLLGMLCTVCDRNLPKEPYWSETSECYMLKLFRDYIFHQVDTFGRPVLDLAHIILNLNKLDAGLDEPIQLASGNSETILLVSYKDLRAHLESSFAYLRKEMDADVPEELKSGQMLQASPQAQGGYHSTAYNSAELPGGASIH